ncbi:MAG: quinol dehydrogenase ferredoxin subunit NapH [Pseudomonadota bacterium]|nr:quinol dehydrogenase ferredoxin subunit NapH [Pseudomonadota bacterium]
MAVDNNTVKLGPNGKPVRPFVMPTTFAGKLKVWRFLIYRRLVQLSTLLLFFGSAHWGWTVAGEPLLMGNLSSSTLLGIIPLADPFAVLQIFLTRHVLNNEVLIGAVIVVSIYALLGGRVWCSWVCPINMVADLAAWLRRRLPIKDRFILSRNVRYTVLLLSLILSVITGVAAFEWVSPISMFHRELIFGIGLGWMAILGVFIFDLFVLRDGWCGHLCPLGAFYALVGKVAPIRILFDTPTCTHCNECVRVCPEPKVLNFKKAGEVGMIASGECTNCGRCTTVCPENTLRFGLRMHSSGQSSTSEKTSHKLEPHHRSAA